MLANRIQPRDIDILKKLVECRIMRSSQIFTTFFEGPSASRGRERLRFLLSLKAIRRIELPTVFSEGRVYAYTPTHRAIDLIGDTVHYVIDKKPLTASSLFLSHILDCSEVNVQFTLSAKRYSSGFHYLNELILKQKDMVDWFEMTDSHDITQRASLIPDAFFSVTTPERPYNFLLEVDRSKEILKDLALKFIKYRNYFQFGVYERRYGTDKGRVLFVCKSMERLRNIKDVCESQGGRSRYWFSTLSALQTQDPLHSPIWYKAGAPEIFSLL